MGANAIRTAHSPPAPEFLDACDRLGMMVMDETRNVGINPAQLGGLEAMIQRDRNHPSVVIWSLGNEEFSIEGNAKGTRIMQTMQTYAQRLDPTRRYTVAISGGWGNGSSRSIDVMGFNYYNHGDTDRYHAQHPEQPSVGTEDGSTFGTRGVYFDDSPHQHLPSYDASKPQTATYAELTWTHYAPRPYVSGVFVWTGFDYRGEEGPNFAWPAINAQFGIHDMCGFPKDLFYYYQSWWQDEPVLHVFPHWNWPGREGQEIRVFCDSNCQEVELFLNGQSQGRKTMKPCSLLSWPVKYAPGTLLARGYKDGKEILTTKVETTGEPAAVRLTPHKPAIAADGADLAIIALQANDAEGRLVPTASQEIDFAISGPGKIVGVGNGDPSSHEADKIVDKVAGPAIAWRMLGVSGVENRPEVAADFDDSAWQLAFGGRGGGRPSGSPPPRVAATIYRARSTCRKARTRRSRYCSATWARRIGFISTENPLPATWPATRPATSSIWRRRASSWQERHRHHRHAAGRRCGRKGRPGDGTRQPYGGQIHDPRRRLEAESLRRSGTSARAIDRRAGRNHADGNRQGPCPRGAKDSDHPSPHCKRTLVMKPLRIIAVVTSIAILVVLPSSLVAQGPWQEITMPTVREAAASFPKPPREYGAIHWALGFPPSAERIRADIEHIEANGASGYMINSGGKQPKYLSPEYMELFKVAVQECKKHGVKMWIEGDDGYPDGFAGGMISRDYPQLGMQGIVADAHYTIDGGQTLSIPLPPDTLGIVAGRRPAAAASAAAPAPAAAAPAPGAKKGAAKGRDDAPPASENVPLPADGKFKWTAPRGGMWEVAFQGSVGEARYSVASGQTLTIPLPAGTKSILANTRGRGSLAVRGPAPRAAAQPSTVLPLPADGQFQWTPPGTGTWEVTFVRHLYRSSPTRYGQRADGTRDKDSLYSLIDYLDPQATDTYIKLVLEPHEKAAGDEFGKTILGFRGDETDFTGFLPWTPKLLETFQSQKGYDLKPYIAQFFATPISPEAQCARADYYDVRSGMFRDNFYKRMVDWCRARHMEYMLHLNHEETMLNRNGGEDMTKNEGSFCATCVTSACPELTISTR